MKDELYVVTLTPQHVEEIHDFLNIEESIFDMEDYEIGEMVDNFIDDVLIRTM